MHTVQLEFNNRPLGNLFTAVLSVHFNCLNPSSYNATYTLATGVLAQIWFSQNLKYKN